MTIQDLIKEAQNQPTMTLAQKQKALRYDEAWYGKVDRIDQRLAWLANTGSKQ